jgi:hypothetical protein
MQEDLQQKNLVGTARMTGVWYLMLAITGMVGFLMLHSGIYTDDPSKTLANLTEHERLARTRLLFEMLIVVSQALAAVWFYKLFKDIDHIAAWALALWGTVNSVVIMISAIAMGGAINVAGSTMAINEKTMLVQIFSQLIRHSWNVGGLFFGLWLIPMGYIVVRSQRMPLWLGRILILGGIGYIANTFAKYIGLTGDWIDWLVIPASAGEFWMIGYLLIFGIRRGGEEAHAPAPR